MHLKNLLHNDLKSNNVLLKLKNNARVLTLADTGKFTLKSNLEIYKLSNMQSGCYNKIYLYLAHTLRNIYD